jgi:hypothetical protein
MNFILIKYFSTKNVKNQQKSLIIVIYIKNNTFFIDIFFKEWYHIYGYYVVTIQEENEMLVSVSEMLKKAKEGKYAAGQFNINNL